MRTLFRVISAAAIIGLLTVPARAALVYSYSFDGFSSGHTYDVSSGGTQAISVYLYEMVTGGDTSRLVTGNGLFSGGVRLSLVSTNGSGADSFIVHAGTGDNNNTNLVQNSGFDDTSLLRRDTYSEVTANFGTSPGVSDIAALTAGRDIFTNVTGVGPESLGGGVYRVLLGTFTFTGGDFGNSITIQATNIDPSLATSYNATWDPYAGSNYDLDQFLTGTYQATITVVPEPPTIAAFAGLAVMGLILWVVYGRRRPAATI